MTELTLPSRRYERAPRRPPAVLATKLRPPAPPPGAVHRPRLLHLLDEGEGCALTVVVAPAGYGKTTLLAQWVSACGRPAAWVSLDERDRDAFRLWAHVGAALAGALPELAPLARPGLPLDRLLPQLAGAVAGGRPAVLVLDDHHRLGRGGAEATLRWFAEQTEPRLQVVVASRTAPPFPLGLLRARGRLVEIGPRRLELTAVEAYAAGVRTVDGWPAGDEAAAAVAEQALAALSPAERRFLAEVSVLERFDAAACEHVLGRDAAAPAALEATPFLVRLEDGYRLHAAFEAVAACERRRLPRGRLAELHRRAAAWRRARGETASALEHALAAGDAQTAAALLRRSWQRDVDQGRRRQALAALERLPDESVGARLELARAWLLGLAGRHDESDAALAAAAAKARPPALPLVEREAALVRAAFARGPAPAGGGPAGAWARGLALWLRGSGERAARELEAARSGGPLVACAATALLSRVAGEAGDRDAADRLARAARALAEEHDLELGAVPGALGAALAAQGRGTEAAALLEDALRRHRECGTPLELVDSLLLLAPVASPRDGRLRAEALLAEAAAILDEVGDPGRFRPLLRQAREHALPRPAAPPRGLTERELTVLRLLASPRTKREIAEELRLSFNTVHSHTKAVYRKLGASSRAEAVARARDEGLC